MGGGCQGALAVAGAGGLLAVVRSTRSAAPPTATISATTSKPRHPNTISAEPVELPWAIVSFSSVDVSVDRVGAVGALRVIGEMDRADGGVDAELGVAVRAGLRVVRAVDVVAIAGGDLAREEAVRVGAVQ